MISELLVFERFDSSPVSKEEGKSDHAIEKEILLLLLAPASETEMSAKELELAASALGPYTSELRTFPGM